MSEVKYYILEAQSNPFTGRAAHHKSFPKAKKIEKRDCSKTCRFSPLQVQGVCWAIYFIFETNQSVFRSVRKQLDL